MADLIDRQQALDCFCDWIVLNSATRPERNGLKKLSTHIPTILLTSAKRYLFRAVRKMM